MSSLSQKDKNTLILAVVALLIVGIAILGIKPAFTGIKETKATNAELSAKKTEMKTEIDALETYKNDLASAKADYAKTGDRVYDCYTNDLIHDTVVAYVEATGLQVQGLDISYDSNATATIKDYKIIESDTTTTEGGQAEEGSIKLASVSVGVFGTKDQIITLLDKINSTEGMYLQDISFSDSAESETGTTTTTVSLYVVIEDTFE